MAHKFIIPRLPFGMVDLDPGNAIFRLNKNFQEIDSILSVVPYIEEWEILSSGIYLRMSMGIQFCWMKWTEYVIWKTSPSGVFINDGHMQTRVFPAEFYEEPWVQAKPHGNEFLPCGSRLLTATDFQPSCFSSVLVSSADRTFYAFAFGRWK